MAQAKMQWTTPQLIVLSKGTPEESVLTVCKYIGAGEFGGPEGANQNGCNDLTTGNCGNCQARPSGS